MSKSMFSSFRDRGWFSQYRERARETCRVDVQVADGLFGRLCALGSAQPQSDGQRGSGSLPASTILQIVKPAPPAPTTGSSQPK